MTKATYVSILKKITNHINLLLLYSFFWFLPLQIVHVVLSLCFLFYLLFFAGCFLTKCFLRVEDWVHLKLQCLQAKGFSPVCVRMCCFRAQAWMQEKSHWSHWKGFSPEWVSMCSLRMDRTEQEKMHWLQLKGFSPEWKSMCVLRSPACEAA